MSRDPPSPEFSRPLEIDRLMTGAFSIEIEADANERAALAERFALNAIRRLCGIFTFEALRGGRRFKAKVRILADVVQNCVVTLDPVESKIDEDVEIVFEPVEGGASVSEVVVETLEDAEPLMGGVLDIGELVATEMALALDPYPRAPGAEDVGPGAESGAGPKRPNPFEILARRKGDG